MSTPWTIAFVVLAAAVVFLSALVIGFGRQVTEFVQQSNHAPHDTHDSHRIQDEIAVGETAPR